MTPSRIAAIFGVTLCFGWTGVAGFGQSAASGTAAAAASRTGVSDQTEPTADRLARGKKLILKDGTFQLVRNFERKGDRVRYFSAERGDWEEIPVALVDWDATNKAEAEAQKADAALVSKVHKQEEAAKIETTLDVDASLEVAKGVFLPPGEGMFAVEGRGVMPMAQVGSEIKRDKKNLLKQVMVPIPIVQAKHNVDIPGPKAKLRITSRVPEFYLREGPPDPDSKIEHSSRAGESGPEVELVRATVKGNKRILEQIRSLLGQETGQDRKTVAIQRWEIANGVYRFTLSEPLQPGEYALAEILQDGMNLFVWDFGVDETSGATSAMGAAAKQ
jgi:hypothetical protein